MEELNEWIPAIVAGGLGLLGGVLATFGISRKQTKEDAMALSLVDLEERYNHAVALLKDLELYRTRMEPTSYAEQRERLEKEAVLAMKDRDRKEKQLKTSKSSQRAVQSTELDESDSALIRFFRRRPELKGFVWGLGLACVGGGLYLSAADEAKPRENGMQAAPMQAAPEQSAQAKEAQARMGELLEILQKEPTNIDAMVELGRLLLRAQLINEAKMVTERTLQLVPDNLDALTHQAVITSAEGKMDAAFDGLDYVLDKDPKFYRAWFFKGMLSMQAGKSEQMKTSFETYIKYAPDSPRKERIKQMLAGGGIQMPGMQGSAGQASSLGRSAAQRPVAPPLGAGSGKRMDELKAVLQKEPENVDALVELGLLHLRVQDLQAAKGVVDKALALAPDNLEALTYEAVIKTGTGDSEGGFAGLDAVLKKDSAFYKAWFFRGMLSMQAGKSAQMKESFEKYIEYAPDSPRKERIKKMLGGGGIQMPRDLSK